MTRPTTHDDLPDYLREGHRVATIVAEYVVRHPSLGQHLLAALAEAERLGMDVENGAITIPKTIEELDAALASQQTSWDANAEWYSMAIAGTPTESWKRRGIDHWAQTEGLDPVDWDAHEDKVVSA